MNMIKEIKYIKNFINNDEELFNELKDSVEWDDSISSRRTTSFGVPYNYSQMKYLYVDFTDSLNLLADKVEKELGFRPNNCLINYYTDGKSRMGYHSDRTDILEDNTGVVILSIGETRILRFKNIEDNEKIVDYELNSSDFIFMGNSIQDEWKHSIIKSNTDSGRMSLTFRRLK